MQFWRYKKINTSILNQKKLNLEISFVDQREIHYIPYSKLIQRLTVLLFFIYLLDGCSTVTNERTIEQTQRRMISFKSYEQRNTSKNALFLTLPDSCKRNFKHINVRLKHGAGSSPMRNFILSISTKNNGYYLVMNEFRFLNKNFDSLNDTIIEKDINLTLHYFRSYTGNIISYQELMNKLDQSKRIAISATMNDWDLLKNPLSSSSLRHSNLIELIYE